MTCEKCTAKTPDGITLCDRCRKTVEHALPNIAAYYAELDLVPTTAVKRRGSTAADPTGIAAARIISDPVAEIDDEAVRTLNHWADTLAPKHPRAVPDLVPWLTARMNTIVTTADAGLLTISLQRLERNLRKVAARADTGQYVGRCTNIHRVETFHDHRSCSCSCHLGPEYVCDTDTCHTESILVDPEVCGRPLYAPRNQQTLKCSGCGSFWDVRARRQQLVREAEEELAPVAVIAHLAALWVGEPSVAKVEARIRKWVQRKRIRHVTTKIVDGRDRKVYRVGDVLDLLTDTPTATVQSESA